MPSLAPRLDTLESTPSFSGAASFAAGSAAAPSLRFTVDPTTGLYRIGVSAIGFTCAGVSAGQISSGAWTLGIPGSLTHTVNGNRIMLTDASAAGAVQLRFTNGATLGGIIGAQGTADGQLITGLTDDNILVLSGMNGIAFSGNIGATLHTAMSTAGVWTFTNSATNAMILTGGATVASRLQLNRGTDDANQYMEIGWNVINSVRANGLLSGNQSTLSFQQRGSDGTRIIAGYDVSGLWFHGISGASGTKVSVNNSAGSMPSICNSRTMSVYNDTNSFGVQAVNGFATYTGIMISAYAVRASSSAFNFISCVNGDGTSYNITNAFVVAGDGTVRAGDAGAFAISPTGEHRFYSSIAQTSFGSVDIFDTRTQTTGVGGMISFSGFKIAQTNGAIYAGIKGSKVNSTSNNEQGQLKFYSSDGSSLKEGGFLDQYSGWTFGLPLTSVAPSFPFKPFIIQTPVSTTAIGFTKFHKISQGTSAVDLVTITSTTWDSGHNLVIYVEAFNITAGLYSIVKGAATSNGASSTTTITLAATDVHNNGLGLGSFAWSAGTGAATLRYTPPTNTDNTVYEITINNRKFPYTLP